MLDKEIKTVYFSQPVVIIKYRCFISTQPTSGCLGYQRPSDYDSWLFILNLSKQTQENMK